MLFRKSEAGLIFEEKCLEINCDFRLRLFQLTPQKGSPFCPLNEDIDKQLARFAATIADATLSCVGVLFGVVYCFGDIRRGPPRSRS